MNHFLIPGFACMHKPFIASEYNYCNGRSSQGSEFLRDANFEVFDQINQRNFDFSFVK